MIQSKRINTYLETHGHRAIKVAEEHGVAMIDIWHPAQIGGGYMQFALMSRTCLSNNTYIMIKCEKTNTNIQHQRQDAVVFKEQGGGNQETKIIIPTDMENTKKFRIRKLPPRECFRLMDVSECDIDKIQQAGISNSQQYKLAGNSIVVSVIAAIFNKLFVDPEPEDGQQLTLF